MNQSEGHSISIQEQKSKIRERYRGLDPDTVECLPARPPENIYDEDRELRVAVYARVSTDDPRQTSSYELQKNHYTDFVNRHPNHAWAIVKRGSFPSAILYITMPIVSIRFYGHCHKKVIIK